jgi:hypothetical protein
MNWFEARLHWLAGGRAMVEGPDESPGDSSGTEENGREKV